MNLEFLTHKSKILNNTPSLINKKHQPLVGGVDVYPGIRPKTPDLNKSDLSKQIFFPLTSTHRSRKESLLNNTSTAYLNSVHPKKLRVNLNEAPSTKLKCITKPPSKSSDEIYKYLKALSKYLKRQKGLLTKKTQHIAYNFQSKKKIRIKISKVAKKIAKAEALINKSLNLKVKTIQSTNGVKNSAITKTNINKNINTNTKINIKYPNTNAKTNKNINDHLKFPLVGLNQVNQVNQVSKQNKNTPKPPCVNTPRTVEPNAPLNLPPEIPQDLNLRLQRLNSLSRKAANIRMLNNNRLIKYSYKLLFYFFKSMYCLISNPVFLITSEKVVIQLNYFLIIPKSKVFKWYCIFKNKLIRHKRLALLKKKIKQRERLKQNNIKKKINLHSDAKLAQVLNHNENLSSKNIVKSYKPKSKYKKHKVKRKVARTLIRLKTKPSLIQKILFNLHKYTLFRVFSPKFKLICEILNKKFKKPVEFRLIRIHQPYQDSNILVNLLSLNIRNKKFKPNARIEKLFQKNFVKNVSDYQNNSVNLIPTYLSGIKIRIGGRLMREALIQRKTTKKFDRGASSIGKVNYLDSASITNKNRKGAYTLKISSGQNFF
jgi:Mitochondrial ribosomal protein (VAR1)